MRFWAGWKNRTYWWAKRKRKAILLRWWGPAANKRAREREMRMREAHEAELAQTTEAVAAIVARCSRIDWTRSERCSGVYRLNITFSPSMLGLGGYVRDELGLIAREFGRRVEHEVATSKFVEAADENERTRGGYGFADWARGNPWSAEQARKERVAKAREKKGEG